MDVEVRIDELLKKYKRSFYWLSKETGISYTTLWRLKNGKALGINFSTLRKLCIALKCQPGDVMKLSSGIGNSGPGNSHAVRSDASAAKRSKSVTARRN